MSFLMKRHTPGNGSTQPPQSVFQNSLSQNNHPDNSASKTTPSWEEEASWADPAGDFELLFEGQKKIRGKG
eukprot:8260367-Ditylum_brightwellii.AAC.1